MSPKNDKIIILVFIDNFYGTHRFVSVIQAGIPTVQESKKI